ncbi:Glutathione S-transferase family protein [Sulfidibacter corallicola]|uniref:Glutathione S-transferase family protein n=1 Tax=Sulfidibacter corallicola TaxID=2818388 RepID=A0A8A4TV32_SULCO|nr:glutathione S-transferase family protein [Sulfidibacter corallicola]QTD53809.1 glutathione S-transferase family protein [Sulfidibacter corallicola]
MKLYNANSGNTKRVRIFIAEKGIEIPRIELELGVGTRTAAFREINSLGEVPVLELDDGRIITESLAICRYLEAAYPEPPLMGRDAFEQGHIEMWSQRVFGQIFMTYGLLVRHSLSLFADVVDQVPEFAETQRKAIPEKWRWLDREMSDGRRFIAGDEFTMADVHGMTVLMIVDGIGHPIPEDCIHVNRWADTMRRRSSYAA